MNNPSSRSSSNSSGGGFFSFFANLFKRKKKNDWLENYAGQNVAKPKNPLPLDNDPWMT